MAGNEQFYMFGNGRQENIVFTLDAGKSVTCHFGKHNDDTDTETDKYFNIRDTAKKVHILPDIASTMTHVNGVELKSPRTLTVGGIRFGRGIRWSTITVRADQDSTTFEVWAS